MALQLKNKTAKEKQEKEGKKYKRRRNVFGKSTIRYGFYALIIFEVATLAVLTTVVTINQNKKQEAIDKDIKTTEQTIEEYMLQARQQQETYENVGSLIATLPTTFDQQATALDIDRMIILAGLTESTTSKRTVSTETTMPFECSIDTIKAVKIDLTLYGENDDYQSVMDFIDYMNDYKHENFYYIKDVKYIERGTPYYRTETSFEIYTFYNDTVIQSDTPDTPDTPDQTPAA